ncbi:unnamed protein product [Angiostrongylus costaricensis]|uniref:C2H2-type domain-containing protein n=1 Tax=Angiostrongylus costaricensis TaxID=334426 RepID=A0A158PEN0_ANGCS|nr:unnamed protein product [Angiostrongylus costaricensis]
MRLFQSSFDALACPHPHCQLSFPNIDDLISHLVSFHCQHQFRQRKLTFISLEKYEAWKSSQEKLFATTMIEEADREENEGVIRLRYSCEYCDGWRRKLEKHGSSEEGMCMRVLLGCPAHFTVSISRQQTYIVVFGCFAHLGHRKKLPPAVNRVPDSNVQLDRWKTSPVGIKRFKSLEKYSPGERGYHLKRYEIRNIADKLKKRGLLSSKEKETGNNGNHFVRFQSMRSLPEERGRCSWFSFAKVKEFTYSKLGTNTAHGIQHSQNPSNPTTASHTVVEELRDLSPPIIGASTYTEYDGEDEYNNLDMVVVDDGDVGHSLSYFIDDTESHESPLDTNPARNGSRDRNSWFCLTKRKDDMSRIIHPGHPGVLWLFHHSFLQLNKIPENTAKTMSSKMAPLLMEPQPTGNADFDETMTSLKRRINILSNQIKRTVDTSKRDILMAQVRNLQGQLVRGVPQTTTFFHLAEEEPDGEEDEDDLVYEPVDRDDTVCLEVEVESSDAPYGVQIPEEHYDDMSADVFQGEPYEEVVSAGYEQSSELSYN